MAVTVQFESFDLTIISIYRHPHVSLSAQDYDSLFAFCDPFSHAIFLGDFNAHHRSGNAIVRIGRAELCCLRPWTRPSLALTIGLPPSCLARTRRSRQ